MAPNSSFSAPLSMVARRVVALRTYVSNRVTYLLSAMPRTAVQRSSAGNRTAPFSPGFVTMYGHPPMSRRRIPSLGSYVSIPETLLSGSSGPSSTRGGDSRGRVPCQVWFGGGFRGTNRL